MIIPKSYEELAQLIETKNTVLFFTADWCGDCVFIKPVLPEIAESFPDYTFIQIDRDEFIDLCSEWAIFGIPSFVVTHDGKETARLVNKERKTKEDVMAFLKDATK